MKRLVRVSGLLGIGLAVVFALLGVGMWFAFPSILAREVENEARREGVELTIERVELTLSQAIFHGVRAKLALGALEGTAVTALDLPFLFKQKVVIRDGTFTVREVAPSTNLAMRNLRGELSAHQDARGSRGPLGSAARVDADVELEAAAGRFAGPWKLAVTRAGPATEQTLDLRPAVPKTAVIQRVSDAKGSRLRGSVKGARLEELALPAFPLAAPSAVMDLDLEADSAAVGTPAETHRGRVKLALSRFTVPGAPAAAAMNASFGFESVGVQAKVTDGRFSFGPFAGTIAGFIDFGSPARLPSTSLDLTGDKISCLSLAQGAAEQALPGVGALAAALGIDRVAKNALAGDVGFVAKVDLSLDALGAAKIDVRPVGRCSIQVPLFPLGR